MGKYTKSIFYRLSGVTTFTFPRRLGEAEKESNVKKNNGNRQVAFTLSEAVGRDLTPERIGGKAHGLVRMSRLGLAVPPAFFVTTGVSRAYLQTTELPQRTHFHVGRCLEWLERTTGKRFGDPSNPLLVSVRSGASVSMPGMMDTILNLGLTPAMLPALAAFGGEQFAQKTYRRFVDGFRKVTGSEPPADPRMQLQMAIEAVCFSWTNDRAIAYRKQNGIAENLGTAVTVQAMVFGNLDAQSGTGVVFSQNTTNGDPGMTGEYLPEAQGEDVVGGGVTPPPIGELQKQLPDGYAQLEKWVRALEKEYSDVVDVEFTVERGQLYILQCRVAKRSPLAAARIAVRDVWAKKLTKAQAVELLAPEERLILTRQEFSKSAVEGAHVVCYGLSASPGAAIGYLALSSREAIALKAKGMRPILVVEDTTPDDLSGMQASVAIVTANGGTTCHAAVVARSLGIPSIVGVSADNPIQFRNLQGETDLVSVDGTSGTVYLGALQLTNPTHGKEISLFLKWATEIKPTRIPNFEALREGRYSANEMLTDFYLLERMVLAAKGTALEHEVANLRRTLNREYAELFAAYLIVASAGEVRRAFTTNSRVSAPITQEILRTEYGYDRTYTTSHDEREVAQGIGIALKDASPDRLQRFVSTAAITFAASGWDSFEGGEAWLKIAKAALDWLRGTVTDALFIDHVFDLRHNGGCLFNKHDAFELHTIEYTLLSQLNFKKFFKGSLVEFYTGIMENSSRAELSPRVEALWQKGLDLWRNG